jgi:putative phosphoesterase
LLSDTHGYLDPAVFDYLAECDEVWHAGDVGSMDVLERLRAVTNVRAVFGNIDGPEVRAELAEDLDWECDGLRVLMTHTGGYPGRWDRRAKSLIEQSRPGLFICGHSHVLRVMRDEALQLLYLNPGAAGKQGWHKARTMLRYSIDRGKVENLEAIELGPR